MSVDLAAAFNVIQMEVQSGRSLIDSMTRVTDFCAAQQPHAHWARFRDLPYSDLSGLFTWLSRSFNEEPPPPTINGLWFGLFNPVRSGQTVADMYVVGSTRFAGFGEDVDWAVRPEWRPRARYCESTILASIYGIAYDLQGLGNEAEYPLVLAYAALSLRDALSAVEPAEIVRGKQSFGIAAGFDSGDFLNLGTLTQAGFRLQRA